MAKKADVAKTEMQRQNSALKRAQQRRGPEEVGPMRAGHAQEHTHTGRALHGRTKLIADAKAHKPDRGRDPLATRPNGGEERTTNGVLAGRGADGPPHTTRPSRKSTRGDVPGGEKPSQLTRAVQRRLSSPEARAARGK